MTIDTVFDPPTPADSPSVFNTKAFDTLGKLNTWSGEANTLAGQVNADKTAAQSAASTATTKASEASTSASTAATKATEAASSASSAATSASTATTKAGEAATSAASAADSASQAAASAASINLASIAITGGTINGATIGATTPASGAFTTVSASGGITNTAASSEISSNNSSATASGSFLVKHSGVNAAGLVAYAGSHATLANQLWIKNYAAGGSIYLAPNGGGSSGLTVSSAGITVPGTSTLTGNVVVGGTTAGVGNFSKSITIDRLAGNSAGLAFAANGAGEAYIFARADGNGGLNISTEGSRPVVFSPGGTEHFRIDSAGDITINDQTNGALRKIYFDQKNSGGAQCDLSIQSVNGDLIFYNESAAAERLRLSSSGNVVMGAAALATTATAGFPWIPSCPGAPTGAPAAPYTNAAALVADTANSRLYVRIGATWKYASLT